MRSLAIAVLTALVGFVAGFGARHWMEGHGPLPRPPVSFLGEFARGRGEAASSQGKPINRAELIAQIQALRPELDAFQNRMDELAAQFERDLDPILTPEQQAKHAEALKRRQSQSGRPHDETKPISDDQITSILREQPGRGVIWDVVIPLRLDILTHQYGLSDEQREKVRALLRARREAFLNLVDSSPPPSVRLIRLVPLVQRIAQPAPAPSH